VSLSHSRSEQARVSSRFRLYYTSASAITTQIEAAKETIADRNKKIEELKSVVKTGGGSLPVLWHSGEFHRTIPLLAFLTFLLPPPPSPLILL
jgi:hypothetical protein